MSETPTDSNPVRAAWRDVEKSFAETEPLELTILMPCLDEAETLGLCIDKACAFLWRSGVRGEVVIADNGSTDGSQEIARARGARVVRVAERGYGAALIAGIKAARGRFVIMGDADDSYDFANLDAFMEKLREGNDVVMGNRFRGGIAESAMPRLHRYLGNPALSFVGRLFFRSPIGDFHCGLRGVSRDAVLGLGLRSPGMEFASEMVVKATLAGLSVAEVPTTLSADGRSRPPHLKSWRDGWRHLKLLLEFAPHWLFLYPGGTLACMGLLLTAALLPGPLTLGEITLDTATLLLAVAAILVGTQLVLFYMVAKTAAVSAGKLPASPRYEAMSPMLTVDRLCLVGGSLFVAGAVVTLVAIVRWMLVGFGDLETGMNIRFAAAATLLMALGVQTATAGFLIGLVRTTTEQPAAGDRPGDDDASPQADKPATVGSEEKARSDEAA
jgi:hypothetical protein